METTVGRFLLQSIFPPEFHSQIGELSAKNIRDLLKKVAKKYPEKYPEVTKKLLRISIQASTESGGYPFSIKDLKADEKVLAIREEYKNKVREVLNDTRLSDEERNRKVIELARYYGPVLENTLFESLTKLGNPLSYLVRSKASGKAKPSAIKNLILGDTLFSDQNNTEIPFSITHALIEGYRPHEYAAGTFGARKGMVIKKLGTQEGGWFAKRLQNAAHKILVTALDRKDDDPETILGLEVDTDDPDNEGSLLAVDTGKYKKNTILTADVLEDLKRQGIKKILVRSPSVGSAPDGGVYAYDVGINEKGIIAPLGDFVGISAAHAIGEPLTQALLNAKHTGGDIGTSKDIDPETVDKLLAPPEVFPMAATYAEQDGKVAAVEKAQQGGHYVIMSNGQSYYVYPDQQVIVKPGDEVEAGDPLSDGIVNPEKLIRLKGIGEARRIFINKFRNIINKLVGQGHRRNVELITRALFDHVKIDEPFAHYLPGDIVRYSTLEHVYSPRSDSQKKPVDQAVNEYLEKPVLHYSIGTRITPRVANHLKQWGIKNVITNKQPTPFTPVYIWAEHIAGYDPDWMTQMLSTHLEKRLLEAVTTGAVSDPTGISYVPALAEGKDFGYSGKTKGWDPSELPINKLQRGIEK